MTDVFLVMVWDEDLTYPDSIWTSEDEANERVAHISPLVAGLAEVEIHSLNDPTHPEEPWGKGGDLVCIGCKRRYSPGRSLEISAQVESDARGCSIDDLRSRQSDYLPADICNHLKDAGYTTTAALFDATDAELLAVHGIGPAFLRLIRETLERLRDDGLFITANAYRQASSGMRA